MANPAHLQALELGVEAWNSFRRDAREQGIATVTPDLSESDLSNCRLAGVDFSGADLQRARLPGADLRGADLRDVDLSGADLTGARLTGAHLLGAKLTRTRLTGAELVDPSSVESPYNEQLAILCKGAEAWLDWRQHNQDVALDLPADAFTAKFIRARLSEAELLDHVSFEGNPAHLEVLRSGVDAWNAWRQENPDVQADLSGVNLMGAELAGVDFSGTRLSGAFLTEADLHFADLSGAWLDNAHLARADLSAASLVSAILFQANVMCADLAGANLSGAELAEANLTGAALFGTQLTEARLSTADFFEGNATHLAMFYDTMLYPNHEWDTWRRENLDVEPNLRGANLIGLKMWDADLSRANLERAHLSRFDSFQAVLSSANLNFAKLVGAELFHARLDGASLCMADLSNADLRGTNLEGARLTHASLSEADLDGANLGGADLRNSNLYAANLKNANLAGANLAGALLHHAWLSRAVLSNANLSHANLCQASMVETILDGASLSGCWVYGVSAWGLDLSKVRDQSNLMITPEERSGLTVDNLELAQFVYMMLHNEKIRGIIDTIGRKAVLILGRFYAERKAVLDALKVRLRDFDLVPIVFDWDKPASRDLTETVALLANMSRFVIADLTDAKSIPQELSEIVPRLPSVPVRPIILSGDSGYAMFEHWKGYRTMLPVFEYRDRQHLIDNVEAAVLTPIEQWEADSRSAGDLEEQLKAKDEEIERLRAALKASRAEA